MFDTTFLDGGSSPDTSSAETSSAPADAAGAPQESISTEISQGDSALLDGADLTNEISLPTDENAQGTEETDPLDAALAADDLPGENPQSEEKTEEELSEEEELARYAADPSTPAFARKQIERAMQLAGRHKADLADRDLRLNELETKFQSFDGKEVLPAGDIERMKQAEEKIFALQAFSATPDDIDRVIQEINPDLHKDYQSNLVLKALEKSDGTPDFDNIQVVIDRWMGEEGAVDAKLVLQAAEALKAGTLKPEQLHEFASMEEYETFQKRAAAERDIAEKQKAINDNLQYQEAQVRKGELTQVVRSVQSQIEKPVMQLFDKFKMTRTENEPKVSSEFKDELNQKVSQIINSAPESVREIGAVFKAIEKLTKPTGKTAPEIAEEVRRFAESPALSQHINKGLSDLMSQIEKTVAREAYRYRLMMKGYEADNSRPDNARPVIGNPNQSANLSNLTQEQLKNMSASERNRYAMEYASRKLRNTGGGTNRYGG
jgi:hypothetical protein